MLINYYLPSGYGRTLTALHKTSFVRSGVRPAKAATAPRASLFNLPSGAGFRIMPLHRIFILCLLLNFLLAASPAFAAQTDSSQARYTKAVADFSALEGNAKQASLRQNWTKVIKGFDPLIKSSVNGDIAVKARYQQARAWEELANRSYSKSDFQEAANAYGQVVRLAPKHQLAAESLYRRAAILGSNLDKSAEAIKVLDTLLARYPKSPHVKAAAKLKAELKAEPKKPAAPTQQAIPKSIAEPAAAASLYKTAAEDWRALLADSKHAGMRDPWLNLEKRFLAAHAKDPDGQIAPKALFQAGRSSEELASRSWLRSDWQNAVQHFLAMAEQFPADSLADDALFRAAFIQARRLDDTEGARKNAGTVLSKYAKGDMVRNARDLLQSLPAAPAASPPAVQDQPAKQKTDSSLATLREITPKAEGKSTTIVLALSAPTSFTSQYINPTAKGVPARLQVDISDTRPDRNLKPGLSLRNGPVTRIRTGQPGQDATRILFDLSGVRHYKVSAQQNPPRIIVQCSQAEDIPGGVKCPPGQSSGATQRGLVPDEKLGTLVEQLGLTVRTIMLDPGHGGKDPGAMGNGIKESVITLRIAKLVGQLLGKKGFTVLYTRTADRFIPLDQRTALANSKKVDLFVSLHINANTDKNICGLETYFLDLARTSSAAHVAARENAISVKGISDLQFILTDLMLSSKLQESKEMARFAHNSLTGRLQKAGFDSKDNGVRSAPFYVLMGARMPAVLMELGYLSNQDDAARLKSPKFQERLAEGIVEGIVAYKQKLDRFASR